MGSLPKTLPPCVAVNMVAVPCRTSVNHALSIDNHQNGAVLPFQDSDLFELEFCSRRQLCSGDDVRPAYELTFRRNGAEHSPLPPGSSLGVICPNVQSDIDTTLKLLSLCGNECIDVIPSASDAKIKARFERSYAYVPGHCTVEYLFKYVIDLRTVLKKAFIKVLGDCCPEGSPDRQVLHKLSSSNQAAYRSEVLEGRMMIFNLLEKFPTCRPSLAVLIEHLARLSPRFYSVANHCGQKIRFIYRPMEFESMGRTLRGQCSTMFDRLCRETAGDLETQLNSLTLGSTDPQPIRRNLITCYVRKNVRNFTFPAKPSTPFMFVCHGTGIAPFSAYVHWLRDNPTEKPSQGWLFYGCRYADRDALIDAETLETSGFHLELRQSRADALTQDDKGVKRGYVQDGLWDYADDVRKILVDNNGELLICGDFQTMAKDTLSVLSKILTPEVVENLLKQNRIKLDVWT